MGFQNDAGKFWIFFAVMLLNFLISVALVQLLALLAPNMILANSFCAIAFTVFALFSGFLISRDKIPDWWIWMHYLGACRVVSCRVCRAVPRVSCRACRACRACRVRCQTYARGLCVDEELWHGTSEKCKVSSVPCSRMVHFTYSTPLVGPDFRKRTTEWRYDRIRLPQPRGVGLPVKKPHVLLTCCFII